MFLNTKAERRKTIKSHRKQQKLVVVKPWMVIKVFLWMAGSIGIVGNAYYLWQSSTKLKYIQQQQQTENNNNNHAIMMKDLESIISQHDHYKREEAGKKSAVVTAPTTAAFASFSNKEDVEHIVNVFRDASVELDAETLSSIPSWSTILSRVGSAPKVYGLESCARFRRSVPAVSRNIGACGMFNSGTNLVTRLLKENCQIPERVEKYGWKDTFEKYGMGPFDAHGMRWQVPWGKHTAAKYRNVHSAKDAVPIVKDELLPVVTIRHPYDWMKSMCHNSYTAKWSMNRICPHLMTTTDNIPINLTVSYGGQTDEFDSLAHLWNGWYEQYWKEASYPFLMVRFEDLIFHTKNVTTQICACAGGVLRDDRPFFHIVDSAKQGPGHGKIRTGMADAWVKYGTPMPPRNHFSHTDAKAARLFLNAELMDVFAYPHP